MNSITDEQHQLYRAYSRSYATEANNRRIALLIDVAFALLAVTITALTITDSAQSALAWLSTWAPPTTLLWLTLRETGLLGDDTPHRRTAVKIQEQFDLTFWKPDTWRESWNHLLCGDPVPHRAIGDLALDYQGSPVADDYWIDTTGVQPNAAALLRTKQSAGWGARGHERYARINRATTILGLLLVLFAALITDLASRETASVVVAAAPLLVGRLQSARAHGALSDRRATLERHISQLLDRATPPTDTEVREAQDELCRMRFEDRRIPTWLYRRYAGRDRQAIDGALAADVRTLRPN